MTTRIDVVIPLKDRRGLSDRELIELMVTQAYSQAQGTIANRGMGMLCTELRLVDRAWRPHPSGTGMEWIFVFEGDGVPLPDRLEKFARPLA